MHPVEVEVVPVGPIVQSWDPDVKLLHLTPQFYRGERYSIIAALTVIVQGHECGEFVLRMNGKTGELGIVNRTATIDPPIAKLAKEALSAPANPPVPGNEVPDPK